MASTDDFTHQLAIKLSRILNIVNPNDLLARTVIDLAKTHPPEGFAKGAHSQLACSWFLGLIRHAITAARAFGKFQDSFLAELHSEILSHEKREATGAPPTVAGIVVHDSDVLEPDPVRQGGLVRPDKVHSMRLLFTSLAHVIFFVPATRLPTTCATDRTTDSQGIGIGPGSLSAGEKGCCIKQRGFQEETEVG
jgi:hypothetical protein